jgi:ribA/ribD-fused uncharacterized protein
VQHIPGIVQHPTSVSWPEADAQLNRQPHYFFKDAVLNQWHTDLPFQFLDREKGFSCCEQYMMYKKALLFGDTKIANAIYIEEDPFRQKQLGRQVAGFKQSTWDMYKYQIVFTANLLKFIQNLEYKWILLGIYNHGKGFLVEASPKDNVWGIGISKEQALSGSPWKGQNLLGMVLTHVAEYISVTEKVPTRKIEMSRSFLRKNPNAVFVFGDNTIQRGHGGAAALRDEPNSLGFITKKYPNNNPASFYTVEEYWPVFQQEVVKLKGHIGQHPHKTFYIAKLGSNLANLHGIWEAIIQPNLPDLLKEYSTQIVYLWE